jgi:hypothetical protein
LLNAELARKKIWHDPAMDFYEALHCRNLTHRASRPHFGATWRSICIPREAGNFDLLDPFASRNQAFFNIISPSNISTTTSQKGTFSVAISHKLVLRGGIPACGGGPLIFGFENSPKRCRWSEWSGP